MHKQAAAERPTYLIIWMSQLQTQSRLFLPLIAVVLTVSLLAVSGCTQQDQIRTYRVDKHESIQIPIETQNDPKGLTSSQPPRGPMMGMGGTQSTSNQRMVAALVLLDEVAWSFKAKAPIDQFPDDVVEKFDELVQTFQFSGSEKPTWDLSEHWKEEPPSSSMRVANLMLGDLEFSVIPVTCGSMSPTECILSNVNRWRGQVGLSGIEADELSEQTRQLNTADGRDALILDIRSPKQEPKESSQTANPPVNSDSGITGETPESWKSIRAGMMQELAYGISADGGTAKVTVSIAGGAVLPNVNRWRGQVGLDAVENEDDLSLEKVTINEQPGLLAELMGEKGQSMVVAMMPADQPKWFFKLMGDTEVVKAESAAFREYITTLKIAR